MNSESLIFGPKVFISYARNDSLKVKRLVEDLNVLGINTFFDQNDINPGENFPVRLSQELEKSDYYVLLVSEASINRPWIDLEWSAALVKDINLRGAFLFLLRLDDSPPPTILAARNYLDAFQDWNGAIQQLAKFWHQDLEKRKNGIQVLPTPYLVGSSVNETIGVYIFNKTFSVQHFMRIFPEVSGEKLFAQVRTALDLKENVSAIGGKVGLRFQYELLFNGKPIPKHLPLSHCGIKNEDSVDLKVLVEHFAPGKPAHPTEYRNKESNIELDAKLKEKLYKQAFGHLFF